MGGGLPGTHPVHLLVAAPNVIFLGFYSICQQNLLVVKYAARRDLPINNISLISLLTHAIFLARTCKMPEIQLDPALTSGRSLTYAQPQIHSTTISTTTPSQPISPPQLSRTPTISSTI